jgi:hypothetical protein
MRCITFSRVRRTPGIPSTAFVPHRRHLSRLPFGAHSATLTGTVAGAEKNA